MKPVTSLAVHCNYFPDSRSGTEGSATYKVKGNIHWVSCAHAVEAEVRIYDRLFMDESPDANNRDFRQSLNPDSKEIVKAYLEPGLAAAQPETSTSSSGTVILSPTSRIPNPENRYSTVPLPCGIHGVKRSKSSEVMK